jgi:hypothetical protein
MLMEKAMSNKKINNIRADFSTQYKDEWARFYPAISEMYTAYMVDDTTRPVAAPYTKDDLNFFDPNNRLMYLPWGLYSAGQAAKNDKIAQVQDMVTGRDRSWPTSVVGDSGGFQIETGTIKWEGNITKERMLRWLERNCDWSMILDFPTGSLDRRGHDTYYEEYCYDEMNQPIMDMVQKLDKSGNPMFDKKGNPKLQKVHRITKHDLDFWFCLDRTMENNDYFILHRNPGDTKFLNVLQGRYHDFSLAESDVAALNFAKLSRDEQKKLLADHKISEVDAWYECVKHYSTDYGDRSFEGWSFAGNHKNCFDLTLRRIIIMLYDGLLEDKPWLHFLGMGQLAVSPLYTLIQKGVRAHPLGNKEFTISHDASSAFSSAGAYALVYYKTKMDKTGWSLSFDQLPEGNAYIGSKDPWVTKTFGVDLRTTGSPLAQFMTLGDLSVNYSDNPDPKKQRAMDKSSYAYLMHHNTYVLQRAIIEAQQIFELPIEEARDLIPDDVLLIKHVIEEVFSKNTKEEMLEVVKRNVTILRALADKDAASISLYEDPELFEVDRKKWQKPSGKMKKDEGPTYISSLDDSELFD